MIVRPTVSVTSYGGIESPKHGTSIGGSSHLFTFQRKDQIIKVLCDVGSPVGAAKPSLTTEAQMSVLSQGVDAMILSHSHNDHYGNLPIFVRNGYRGPIYCSLLTAQIIPVVVTDALNILKKEISLIQEKNTRLGKKLNRALSVLSHVEKNHSKAQQYSDAAIQSAKELVERYGLTRNSDIKQYMIESPELPYDENDIIQLVSQVKPVPYSEYFWIENKVLGAKFYEAGHVVGAHQTIFDFHYDKYNYSKVFGAYFSGDLGRSSDNILLNSPVVPQEKINLGLMESTYGGREHSNRDYELGMLVKELNERKNMAVIPAFSLQRMQEIVHILVLELLNGTITLGADEYIYVDSKLGFAISQILLASDTQKFKALLHEKVKFITTKEQQKAILSKKSKSIVVAGGGMAQGGPSVTYITELGKYADVKIIFVGYQAVGTLGRQILDQASTNRVFDVEGEDNTSATIRAKVVQLKSFSGHASHSELIEHLEEMKLHKDNHILLVHGGVAERQELAKGIKSNGYIPGRVVIPELYKTYTVDCETKKQIS